MKMKPYVAHYMNKYPNGTVDSDGETYLRAYDAKGKLRVVLGEAAGSVQDRSKALGCPDSHDLSPIPKDTRVWCDKSEGIERHQDADARQVIAEAVAAQYDGRVPSVEEMAGDHFGGSKKFTDDFRAQTWMEKGSVPAKMLKKKK